MKIGPLAVNTKLFAAIALFALANSALINMIMASRLLYGMTTQGIVPPRLGRCTRRRTPWVAILVHDAPRDGPRLTGDLSTSPTRPCSCSCASSALVNVAVLVLRRDAVDHDHFRAPTVMPVIGAVDLHRPDVHEGGRDLPARRAAAPARRGVLGDQPGGAAPTGRTQTQLFVSGPTRSGAAGPNRASISRAAEQGDVLPGACAPRRQ